MKPVKPKNVFDSIKSPTVKELVKKPEHKSVQDIFERLSARSTIKGWNGESSKTFESSGWNGTYSKRARDDYDDELDRGRTKKVKNKHAHRRSDKESWQRGYEKNRRSFDNNRNWKSWDGRNNSHKKRKG